MVKKFNGHKYGYLVQGLRAKEYKFQALDTEWEITIDCKRFEMLQNIHFKIISTNSRINAIQRDSMKFNEI